MMMFFKAFVVFLIAALVALFLYSRYLARQNEMAFPPVGQFAELEGTRLHYVDVPAEDATAPTVIFLHGATGNLLDQMVPFRPLLDGKLRQVYLDRPGLGYSTNDGADFTDPARQARAISELMAKLKIEDAVIVGHSLAGATVGAFALNHPDKVRGLVFMSAVTHPWDTGVDWYYDVLNTPLLGSLFANTVAIPAGMNRMRSGAKSVFSPAPMPEDYVEASALPLIFRPYTFLKNGMGVARVIKHVRSMAPQYPKITAPAFIIHGKEDDTVSATIHSVALDKALPNSELQLVEGIGHKPEYSHTELIVEKILGMAKPRD